MWKIQNLTHVKSLDNCVHKWCCLSHIKIIKKKKTNFQVKAKYHLPACTEIGSLLKDFKDATPNWPNPFKRVNSSKYWLQDVRSKIKIKRLKMNKFILQ